MAVFGERKNWGLKLLLEALQIAATVHVPDITQFCALEMSLFLSEFVRHWPVLWWTIAMIIKSYPLSRQNANDTKCFVYREVCSSYYELRTLPKSHMLDSVPNQTVVNRIWPLLTRLRNRNSDSNRVAQIVRLFGNSLISVDIKCDCRQSFIYKPELENKIDFAGPLLDSREFASMVSMRRTRPTV